jgi:hypothetical protein
VFPERQQAVIANGLLQRDAFDQEPFPAAYRPCLAYATGFGSSTRKPDDVVHSCPPRTPSHPERELGEIQAQLFVVVQLKKGFRSSKLGRGRGSRLRRAQTPLRVLGIEIVFGGEGWLGTGTIRITAMGENRTSRVSDRGEKAGLNHPPPGLK